MSNALFLCQYKTSANRKMVKNSWAIVLSGSSFRAAKPDRNNEVNNSTSWIHSFGHIIRICPWWHPTCSLYWEYLATGRYLGWWKWKGTNKVWNKKLFPFTNKTGTFKKKKTQYKRLHVLKCTFPGLVSTLTCLWHLWKTVCYYAFMRGCYEDALMACFWRGSGDLFLSVNLFCTFLCEFGECRCNWMAVSSEPKQKYKEVA